MCHSQSQGVNGCENEEEELGDAHRENQVVEAAALNTVCKTQMPAGGFFVSELRQSASQNLSKRMELSRQQRSFWKGFVRLIGANSETKKPPASLLGLQTVLMAAASAL